MPLESHAERISPSPGFKLHYNRRIMPRFFSNLLRALRERRGTGMSFICCHLLPSAVGRLKALAQEIISAYRAMNEQQRLEFSEMLSHDFAPDEAAIVRAASDYKNAPGPPRWPRCMSPSNLLARNCSAASTRRRTAPKRWSPCENMFWLPITTQILPRWIST